MCADGAVHCTRARRLATRGGSASCRIIHTAAVVVRAGSGPTTHAFTFIIVIIIIIKSLSNNNRRSYLAQDQKPPSRIRWSWSEMQWRK